MVQVICTICGEPCTEGISRSCPECNNCVCDECGTLFDGYCQDCFDMAIDSFE